MGKKRHRVQMDPSQINDAFHAAWEEFGDDKSTEFLIAITADRCLCDYDDVIEALALFAETYRTDSGPTEVDHAFEELEELHDLIELGPSWDCIEAITIRPNPRRPQPKLTIEEAEQL